MKIAVIGSGIAGLSAAWLLNRTAGREVSLFEAGDYLGGHSNTIDVTLEGFTHPVDTGFLVHNPLTYPNLIAFFKLLNIEVVETEMTFSVKLNQQKIEWAGNNLFTIFSQKKNLFNPRFWKMILDILRFNKKAKTHLQYARKHQISLGELLKLEKYSNEFRDWYLLPMGAAIWSTATAEMLLFPAENFIQFCLNHSLLQSSGRPVWRSVKNGSRQYVQKIASELPQVFLNEAVLAVTREKKVVKVFTAKNRTEYFDNIVLATHSDQALALLKDASPFEKEVLSKIRYQPNTAYLHTDELLLPDSKAVWSAWNYRSESDTLNGQAVSVSYLINHLQALPFKAPVIVTLNPIDKPRADKLLRTIEYRHPVFDRAALDSQKKLATIQGENKTYFAGAWCGYGFHEDGLKAGMNAAHLLGATIPW